MVNQYDSAPGVICPECGSLFVDDKFNEKMHSTNPENQAHDKALQHFSENHSDWLDENLGFPGFIPVEKKVLSRFIGGSEPRKLKDVLEAKP